VIRLRIPSLRERREDIAILIRHFLKQSAQQLGVESKRMSDSAMQFLSQLNLPGNVRQLENLCNWIVVMAPGQTVEIKDLPPELLESTKAQPQQPQNDGDAGSSAGLASTVGLKTESAMSMPAPVFANWQGLLEAETSALLEKNQPNVMDGLARQFESILIQSALKFTNGKKNEAAIRLGIGRNTITRKLAELNIETKE
jgi:two-component system nitrogen regulation response regulator GlnG